MGELVHLGCKNELVCQIKWYYSFI